MTNEEINIAIAEACGWTKHGSWWSHPTLPDNGGAEPDPPDYCHDLNAMHEAENLLNRDERDSFCKLLVRISETLDGIESDFNLIHATARQHAEAFLRIMGRWNE